jgi:hypothetical protein
LADLRADLRPVEGVAPLTPLTAFEGVEVIPLMAELPLVRIGVDLEVDGLDLEAKYAELVVSSSLIAGAGCCFLRGVVDFLALTSSSSSSSETTFRPRPFFSDALDGWKYESADEAREFQWDLLSPFLSFQESCFVLRHLQRSCECLTACLKSSTQEEQQQLQQRHQQEASHSQFAIVISERR